MDNKYEIYDNVKFNYHYPYSWKKRNIKYLEKRDDRKITKLKPKVIISTNEGNQQEWLKFTM